MRDGDIIVRFADENVATLDDLHRLLTQKEIGKAWPLTFLRGNRTITAGIVPGTLPKSAS